MRQRLLVSIFFILAISSSTFPPTVYGIGIRSTNNISNNVEIIDGNIILESTFNQGFLNEKEYWALFVAINDYPNGILPYSINEINQFKNTLIKGGNWEEDNIRMLLDEDATENNIISGFEWLAENADRNDIVIFYFVGHGIRNMGMEHIITYDAFISDIELDGYLDTLDSTVITILDSCYSGGFIEELKQKDRVILTACKADENTYQVKDLKSGIFGYYLNLTLKTYTKFAESTFFLTWLFSVSYSQKLSQRYNESYTIHPQLYDGTLLRTRLINRHSYFKNVILEFYNTLSFTKNNEIFQM